MRFKIKGLASLAGGLLLAGLAAPLLGQIGTQAQRTTQPESLDVPGSGAHSTSRASISRSDARQMRQIIAREHQRYSHLLPRPGMTGPMLDASRPINARANGQWVNIGPFKADYARYGDRVLKVTDSGDVNDIATDPLDSNIVYAAFSQGGLWKSMDGGLSWRPKTEHLANISSSAIAIDPTDTRKIYVGQNNAMRGASVLRSLDGGETWVAPVVLEDVKVINQLMLMPLQPHVMFVATESGAFRSNDAGLSFSKVPIGDSSATLAVSSIAWAGNETLVAGTGDFFPKVGGQIWRSLDAGLTWHQVPEVNSGSLFSLITVASAASNPSTLYALAGSVLADDSTAELAEIFKTTDAGATWSGVAKESGGFKIYANAHPDALGLGSLLNGAAYYSQVLGVDPSDPNRVFFGGGNLIAATDDGGRTFRLVTDHRGNWNLPYVHNTARTMHFARDASLYIGSSGGLARSRDVGISWNESLNQNLPTHTITQLCSGNPSGMITLSDSTGTRVRVGTTGTFNQELPDLATGCVVDPNNSRNAVLIREDGFILKTIDGGNSWKKACDGIPDCDHQHTSVDTTLWSSRDASQIRLYTTVEGSLFTSTDFGESWHILPAIPSAGYIFAFTVAPSNSLVMAMRSSEGIQLSVDGGLNWSSATKIPGELPYIQTLEFDPLDNKVLYAASRLVRPGSNHLWRTDDFGKTWNAIDTVGFPTGIHVYDVITDAQRPGTVYAGTFLGVYRSTDRGDSWERFGQGMPFVRAYDLSLTTDGKSLHAGTGGRGVWEISLADADNDDGLRNGVPVNNIAGAKSSEQFWTMTVPANASTLRFVTAGGTGDADLYVKFGEKPTTTSYDCRSNTSSRHESCLIAAPKAGTYHVMLRGWNAYAGVSLTGSFSTVARTVYANEADMLITDLGTVSSPIVVSGRSGNAPRDTQVEVDIRHTYRGDLKVELVAPNGTAYLLHDRTGGSADDLRTTYTVDLSSAPITGEWTLRVSDVARGDTGHIDRWSIAL